MRIALLSDIHGNTLALDAVLKDIEAQGGVDGYWVLGDISINGFDPAGAAERIAALPNAIVIRGNGDRYVVTGERPEPSIADATANPARIPQLVEVAGTFAWVRGYLQGRGLFEWMRALPAEQRITLPDGTRVLLVHAAPGGIDDGRGLHPALSDVELEVSLAGCDADVICVGHFHMPMERRLKGWHVVNPGSAGASFLPDLRASYAILDATAEGYSFAFFRVDYDMEAALEAVRQSHSPGAGFSQRFLRGEIRAFWMDRWDGVTHLPSVLTAARQ